MRLIYCFIPSLAKYFGQILTLLWQSILAERRNYEIQFCFQPYSRKIADLDKRYWQYYPDPEIGN